MCSRSRDWLPHKRSAIQVLLMGALPCHVRLSHDHPHCTSLNLVAFCLVRMRHSHAIMAPVVDISAQVQQVQLHITVHRDCTSAAAVAAGAGCHGSLLINWVTSCRADVFPTRHFATRSRTGSTTQHWQPVSASSPLIGLLTSMGGANGDCLLPVSGRVGEPRIWSPFSCHVLVR